MRRDEALGGEIELVVVDEAGAIGEHARLGRRLTRGKIRIPDAPRIDAAALERRARVGRCEVGRLDVADAKPRMGQRRNNEVVDVRPLEESEALAFKSAIGCGSDEILWHQDRLAPRAPTARPRHRPEWNPRGLREDRRRLTGDAEVDATAIHRFEERRPGGEFRPREIDAERLSRR